MTEASKRMATGFDAAALPADVAAKLIEAVGQGGYELQTQPGADYGATVVIIHLTQPPAGLAGDFPVRLPLGISRKQAEQTWQAEVDRFVASYRSALEQATAPGSATRASLESSGGEASEGGSNALVDATLGEGGDHDHEDVARKSRRR